VRTRGGAIESEITLSIDPGANIAEVTSTVSEATGAVLREQVGATQVRRPTIKITYDELDVRHPVPRPTAPPEGPLPPPPAPVRRPPEAEHLSWQPPRPEATIAPPPGGHDDASLEPEPAPTARPPVSESNDGEDAPPKANA
jgi:hypothetical protein